MEKHDLHQDGQDSLRRRAEELWREHANVGYVVSPDKALHLLHELEVHQIELEMQNEELRRAQEELATSRARYFNLYDLAPVGYLTLSEKGQILEANLTAAMLLGLERSQLTKQPVTRFILRDDQDIYYLHHHRLLATREPQGCELRMVRGAHTAPQEGGTPLWVRFQSMVALDGEDVPVWRATLSDITERKLAETELQLAHDDLELRVQERTAELASANEALRQSRDQLQRLAHRLVEAQENERAAIARELHDGAGQALTCIQLDLGALAREVADSPQITAQIQKLHAATDELMSELHALAANLHPAVLDRLGLVPALEHHVRTIQGNPGPQIRVQAVQFDAGRLRPETVIAVYRVVQEAVNNAIHHAQARNIGIIMQMRSDHLLVTIEDDGIGFKADAPAEGRLGLLSMNERIEMLGGNLTIESAPGSGTTIFVDVPL